MGLSPPDRGQVLLWLHGYYAGAAQRTLLEPDRIAQGGQALQKLCESAPGTALIGAEARAALLGDGAVSQTTQPPATVQAPSPGPSPAGPGLAAPGGRPGPAAGALPGAAAPAAGSAPPGVPRPVREPAQ